MKLQAPPMDRSIISKNQAFSLVEVVMAIGLMSFCLVAMMGMLPVGLAQERKSTDQMQALQALSAIASDFRNAPVGSTETPVYGLTLPAVGGSTTARTTILLDESLKASQKGGGPQVFEVSYKMEPPASAFSSYRLSVRICKSNRAGASTDLNMDSVETVILKPLL